MWKIDWTNSTQTGMVQYSHNVVNGSMFECSTDYIIYIKQIRNGSVNAVVDSIDTSHGFMYHKHSLIYLFIFFVFILLSSFTYLYISIRMLLVLVSLEPPSCC